MDKAKWYYTRGLNNVLWRKKYFNKYGRWIWGKEMLEADTSMLDRILHTIKPFAVPFSALMQSSLTGLSLE
ncbi:MAG: hypothetical protein IPJ03_16270 [Ignavibacteriales bacterium]|nr:hypothetical protein [Ignavibacteriales bacterium]MBK7380511.1 hypothetical protein [Ignavibacteriales bacterium]